MVTSCSALNCTKRFEKGSKRCFHAFPKDGELRAKWLQVMNRPDFVPSPFSKLCSDHFNKDDYVVMFGLRKLKEGTVPSHFSCEKPHRENSVSNKKLRERRRKLSFSGRNSNIGERVSQADDVTPFTKVYIKEEQPDIVSIEECHMDEADPLPHKGNLFTEEVPEATGCINNELEINRTVLFDDEASLEDKPHIPDLPSLKSKAQSNGYIVLNKKQDYEMKSCLQMNFDIKEEVEELLPEEVEIKAEDEGEWKNTDNVQSINVIETASNSLGGAKQTGNKSKLDQGCYQITHFEPPLAWSQQKLFVCNQCDYITIYCHVFKEHHMRHLGEKPFVCDQCDYKCSRKSDLKRHHLMKHSGQKPYACDQCNYKCSCTSDFKLHKMSHSGEKPFACSQCSYKSVSSKNLKLHRMIHSGEKQFTCDQCDYKGTHSGQLRQHLMKHSGEKPFVCDQCDFKSIYLTSLRQHQMNHSGDKPFACDQCDYTTMYFGNLKKHSLKHSGEKPFACDQCNYRSGTFEHLKRHQTIHFPVRLLACDQCDYKTNNSENLRHHQIKHTGEMLACSQCDYKTAHFGHLKEHLMRHSVTRAKPFACDQCSYKCTRESILKQHQMKHSGAKPLCCDVCSYKTAFLGNLKAHQATHSDEKPYACHQCEYKTTSSRNLKHHQMKHTGEKPFACNKCNFKCRYRISLKRHQKKHL